MNDDRKFHEVLLPRLKAASEKFDMVPCPQNKYFEPQEWLDTEDRLPEKIEPYFLKNATGPAYEVGGTVCRPLITTAESGDKFSIGAIESSSQFHSCGIFADEKRYLRFDNVHHAFQVVEGSVEFKLASDASSRLAAGEVIYVPKGSSFRFRSTSRYSRMYAFTSGGGIVEVLSDLGIEHMSPILPESAGTWDGAALESLQSRCSFSMP